MTVLTIVMCISWAPLQANAERHAEQLQIAVIGDVPSTDMAIRLLSAAYSLIGIEMVSVVVPSRRALLMANSGAVDGDLFRIETAGKSANDLIKVPYPLLEGRLLAVVFDPEQIPDAESRVRRVAVRRGVVIAERTAEELGMSPVLAKSYHQMRRLLEWGRVDLALVSDIEGQSPLNTGDWDHLHIRSEPITRFTLYHYLHRRHADLVAPLAEALEKLEASGEKCKILGRACEE